MYFSGEENQEVLRSVARVMKHADSRLWSDWVTQSVVDGSTQNDHIAQFLDGMEELGEKFIFGSDSPDTFLRDSFAKTCVTTAKEFLGSDDPTFETY